MRTSHLLSVLLACLLLTPFVAATAGVSLPSIEQRRLVFVPGASYEWEWSIFGAEVLTTSLEGDLAEYATLSDPMPNGSARSVKFSITLPQNATPGYHSLSLLVLEGAPNGGMVGGRAGVRGGIVFIELYPGPYAEIDFQVADAAIGAGTKADISYKSWSKVDAPDVYADIVVKDANQTIVLRTTSEHILLPSQETRSIVVPLATKSLGPGRYSAEATFHNLQDGLIMTDWFRVGAFDLNLKQHTDRLSAGSLNRFTFVVESNWNEPIKEVFGSVTLAGITSEPSASTVLKPFGEAPLNVYVDTSAFNLSSNPNGTPVSGTIRVSFLGTDGQSSSKEFPITVLIVPEQLPETQVTAEELEKPGIFALLKENSLLLIYFALILLVLINVVLLFLQWRKNKNKPDANIRPPGAS